MSCYTFDMSLKKRKRWWRRGCLAVVLITGLTVVMAAVAVKYVFDAEFYRRLAEARLQAFTGLPVTLDSLDVGLFPAPHVEGRGLVVGEGDFRAEADRVIAGFDLRELLSGGHATGRVRIDRLQVRLPENAAVLSERVSDLMDTIHGRPKGEGLPLDLHRVGVDDLQVMQGARLRVRGRGEVLDALGPRPELRYAFTLPTVRGAVAVEGTGHVNRAAPADLLAEGDATVSTEAFRLPGRAGTARVSLESHIEAARWNDVYATFDGTLTHEALNGGTLQGKAWWRDGEYIGNDIIIQGTGLDVTGDFTYTPGQPVAVHIAKGRFTGGPLGALLARLAPGKLQSAPGGTLTLTALTLGVGEGTRPRFVQGYADIAGLTVFPGASWPAIKGVSGSLTVAENVITLREMGNDRLRVSGTITPDFDRGGAALSLSGTVQIDDTLLPPGTLPAAVSGLAGRARFDRVEGTFHAGGGFPANLVLAGRIEAGRVVIEAGRLRDRLEQVTGTFSGGGKGLTLELVADSETLGAVSVNGEADLDARTFVGNLDVDLARAMFLVQREGALNPYVKGLCTGYGRSTFDTRLAWGDAPALRLSRMSDPRPDLDVAVGDAALGDIHGSGDVDLAWFAPALPPRVHAVGTAPVVFDHRGVDQVFSLDVNLNRTSIAAGKYLEKKTGDHARLEVTGRVVNGQWTPKQARVGCLGETLELELLPGRVVARGFRLRLAELVKLLPPGATATGALSGTVTTGPFAADVTLEGAGFGVSPEVKIDSLDGRVTYRDGTLLMDGLRVLGADSDCTVSAGLVQGKWTGRVQGDKLNLNALEVMYDSARALYKAKGRPQAPEAVAGHLLTGRVNLDIRSLYYRRGRVDDVTGRLVLQPDRMRLEELAFRIGRGRVTGEAWLRYRSGNTPARVAARLQAKDIDLKVVDDLVLEEPRGMRGTADVNLAVRFPVGTGKAWQQGLDGALVFSARDGTYGHLAHGGALLALLKTTRLFRLKLPQYREQGLSFKTTAGRIEMARGVVILDPFVLDAGSHAMDGELRIDYPADTIQGEMRFYILESVTGLLDRVPGLGGAAEALKARSGLRIAVRGTPEKPVFGKPEEARFEHGPLLRGGKDAVRQGASAVEDSLRAGTRSIRKTIEAIGF